MEEETQNHVTNEDPSDTQRGSTNDGYAANPYFQQASIPITPTQTPVSVTVVQKKTENRNWLIIVLFVSAFIIPGFGFFLIPLGIFFWLSGRHAKKTQMSNMAPESGARKAMNIIGWIAMSVVLSIVGLFTLIVAAFSTGAVQGF